MLRGGLAKFKVASRKVAARKVIIVRGRVLERCLAKTVAVMQKLRCRASEIIKLPFWSAVSWPKYI